MFCLTTLCGCAGDSVTDRAAALDSLVEAERAFSRAASELGTRDAFVANLAADAVLFRPRAVNAQSFLSAQPDQPGLLSWEPAFADVSISGDLGFTTGPWEFRPEPQAAPVAYGHYFTFWKKQADGTWKVVIDHGIFTPAPTESETLHYPEAVTANPRWRVDDETRASGREALLQVDGAFSAAVQAEDRPPALESYVVSDVRILRNGTQPLDGIGALRAQLTRPSGAFSWVAVGGDLSGSGDLAYTYGEYSFTATGALEPEEAGNYVRAWRRQPDGSWRITVDLMTPLQ